MWRILLVCGAALLGYGCSRKNEEHDAAPANSTPRPSVAPTPAPYTYPTGFTLPRPVTPAVVPRVDCSRFQLAITSGGRINEPQRELSNLNAVIRAASSHLGEMSVGNYAGVAADQNIIGILTSLQGRNMYLQNGLAGYLDTAADMDNINAAQAWLNYIATVQADADVQSEASWLRRNWDRNNIVVNFVGYRFYPNEIRQDATNGEPLFRIVTKDNFASFRTPLGGPLMSFPNNGAGPCQLRGVEAITNEESKVADRP